MFRKWIPAMLILALCLGCCGCSEETAQGSIGGEKIPGTVDGGATLGTDTAEMFTDRDMDGSYEKGVTVTLSDAGSSANGAGVSVEGDIITVTAAGTYRFTGKLTNGQIRVNVGDTDKVQLVLDSASVSSDTSAALYVLSGDKVFVTLVEGTENALATAGEYVQTDDNTVDGAVFSKSDLVFNGTGSLTVISENGHGVVSKDDLKITGGTYMVVCGRQGLSGNDSVRIAGGSITVESGTDAIHAENNEDTTRGYVYISGGTFDLTSGGDAVSASGQMAILDGDFTIYTGEGSDSVTHTEEGWGGGFGGWGDWGSSGSDESTVSCKGLKSDDSMTIYGGTFRMDTQDDAIHCGDSLLICGGEMELATGDDGVHSDSSVAISDGVMNITKSYEGLEGNYITIAGGDITLVASDDGLNAAGGNDGSGMAGPWGQGGGFGEATDAYIAISGGKLVMNAGGDGIDSNGDLTVTGGTVYLDGPTNSGNGALDYAGEAKITGGTFIALGSSGMAMNFGTGSTQGAILCGLNGFAPAGTQVSVEDSDGNVLASYVSQKTFQAIVITAPGMGKGETYTVKVGDASGEFTLDSIIYGSGMGGGMGGGGMGGGGRPGR